MRFSARARLAGDATLAARLEAVEAVGIELAARAAPSRFHPGRWFAVLQWAGYPSEALHGLMSAMATGATIDPQPDALFQHFLRALNHASLYAHIPFVAARLQRQLDEGTLLPWPSDHWPFVVAPLGVVVKHKDFAEHTAFKVWERANAWRLAKAAAVDAELCNVTKHTLRLSPEEFPVLTPPGTHGAVSERLIHDARLGINDRGSPPDMQRLDTLRAIAYAAQPGDYTWAEDICGAFKLVRVVGWQIPLLASAVLGMVVVDSRLTFGLNMSPYTFQAMVGHPLLWLAIFLLGVLGVAGRLFQYVDDHIGLAQTRADAFRQRNAFYMACEWLNIPLEPKKRKPPAQRNLLLGLILDTSGDVVRLECPADKLQWVREVLGHASTMGTISLEQMESVCGMVGFIGVAIRGALVFSAELRDALRRTKAAQAKFCTLTQAMRTDIQFWCQFARGWNGVEVVPNVPAIPTGHMAADAMSDNGLSAIGLFACGRGLRVPIDRERWAKGSWPESASDIAILELIAYALLSVLAAALFGDGATSRAIPGVTDNAVVRYRIERGWCRDAQANAILRFVLRVATVARVDCAMTWVSSEENTLSDAPSRDNQADFAKALELYYSDRFSDSAAPAWWPRGLRHEPGSRRPFACCGPDTALGSLAHNLGTIDCSEVFLDAQKVALLLRRVRAELF